MDPLPTSTPDRKRIGDFEILRELGRGGMGVVYEAVQVSLGRKVALKILSTGLGLTPQAVQRFQREAESAAKLHHTNIIPIYATGAHDGIHFYAMELIEGPSLDHVIRQMRGVEKGAPSNKTPVPADGSDLTVAYDPTAGDSQSGSAIWMSSSLSSGAQYFDTVARLMAEVADALEYAHRHGVVHRDIKPANLLVAPEGRLSLNDFGLARVLEQPGMTATGEILGTPAYMSPEQLTAGRTPLDHRTDIYSLGATLYELLTQQRPFVGERRDQVLSQILHKEPRTPRSVNKKVPVDLETICLKAMEKDPDRRYQTAGAMAEDLRRYVNRFAISARRVGALARSIKWAKRHPTVAALLACLIAVLSIAGYFVYETNIARNQLVAEQRQAGMDRAILEAMSGDAQAALEAIAQAESKGAEPGQLNMLRGLVERHRGRAKEAIVYLEQAEKQIPTSVAIKALLATTYVDDGQWQRFDEMYSRFDQLDPKTPEDYLFLSLGHAEMDPLRALEILEIAPARSRRSAVARLASAYALHYVAAMTGRVEDVELTLEELRKADLPDNPLQLYIRIRTLITATHIYGPEVEARREAVQKELVRDVKRLEEFRDNPVAIHARCLYYFDQGNADALLDEVRRAKSNGAEVSFLTEYVASVLYARKEFDEALRIFESSMSGGLDSWLLTGKGYTLAAIPGRKREAEVAFNSAVNSLTGGISLSCLPACLQLLGPEYKAKSQQSALEIRNRFFHLIPSARNGWYRDLLDYNAGIIDDEKLLKKADESRFNQCEGHYYIGLRRLAEGNRADAKVHFGKSFDSGVFYWYECTWSRAFLAHIDDPAWLPWIPIKQKL